MESMNAAVRGPAFQAPRALAKYRLGNEAETYAELVFVNNWPNPEQDTGKALVQDRAMVMAKTLNLQTYDPSSEFKLREAFVQGSNLFSGRFEQRKFWAGNRYYMRQDIHINYFWYRISGLWWRRRGHSWECPRGTCLYRLNTALISQCGHRERREKHHRCSRFRE